MRRKWHSHVWMESSSGDELHLIDSLLFAPFVLEPHLDHSHGQTRVLSQLFPNLTRRFRILIEASLQYF